jgi:hypothetical protein
MNKDIDLEEFLRDLVQLGEKYNLFLTYSSMELADDSELNYQLKATFEELKVR